MSIHIVDGGGRGQALGMKLAGEGHEVFISPGNPGNQEFAVSTGVAHDDIAGLMDYTKRNSIGLTLPGQDLTLLLGIVDAFQEEGLEIFGPTKAQARIEWDRDWAKHEGRMAKIPMGRFGTFSTSSEALSYAQKRSWPLFLKQNGLARGKGATPCEDIEVFKRELDNLNQRLPIDENNPAVVEDFVDGPEASLHSFCDGVTEYTIPFLVRDHKTIGEHNTGPMTGGVGTLGPLAEYTPGAVKALGEQFSQPIVERLGFKGLLFPGLKGSRGKENALEWNARFGDPEAQVYLSLMKSGLYEVLQACNRGELSDIKEPEWELGKAVVCLVLYAENYGYGEPVTGGVIEGLEAAAQVPGVQILQAGTAEKNGNLVVASGRVINLISQAIDLKEARQQMLEAAQQVSFGGQPAGFRRDIAA